MELNNIIAFLSLFQNSEGKYVPFKRSKEVIRRPTSEDLSRLAEGAKPLSSPRSIREVIDEAQDIFSYGFRVDHTRFFSCIPSPASPISWLGDAMTSAFNAFGGSWEAGTGVCAIENNLIQWIAQEIFGLPSSSGGQFVSGASMANLTALIVARDQILGNDPIQRSMGIAYISDQTHFCVAKALRIVGIPDSNIRVIRSDAQFRMDVFKLELAISEDILNGYKPFVIVATCGTTNTGSIDPLKESADISRTYNVWMHVDAAYGGSVAFSRTHKELVKGLENADSIAWDAHKWLFQTHGCGLVIFRNKAHPLKSFASSASYVADVEDTNKILDPWNYGIELTRPARHMRLWFTLQVLGLDVIDRMISRGFYLAKLMETELRNLEDWEIIAANGMGILNFRFVPKNKSISSSDLDQLNSHISKQLIEMGIAVMFTTRLKGIVTLRMCTINPGTTDDEIRLVVKALDYLAREPCQVQH
ncbi:Pyridoxal-dependent decarboxylase conserved domain protein [Aspergillus sclerotialis]|uniref:Pyridoxal-dependent decarboxylase conserved domain protein n=1 Tax=Aspergillus sclerotialis TaxID=2070753 RepID=A0A3A2ZJP8_9EURO|nr:Pyridoxal-dependent decarboxylase conserved domain protein [Aspergillus sclerotialis]